jgi:hypothetical protein
MITLTHAAGAMAQGISGLEHEFGPITAQIIAGEEADFLWEARETERWIGAYEGSEDEDFDLDLVAIVGRLDGAWFAAKLIIDGEGQAYDVVSRCNFTSRNAAYAALSSPG